MRRSGELLRAQRRLPHPRFEIGLVDAAGGVRRRSVRGVGHLGYRRRLSPRGRSGCMRDGRRCRRVRDGGCRRRLYYRRRSGCKGNRRRRRSVGDGRGLRGTGTSSAPCIRRHVSGLGRLRLGGRRGGRLRRSHHWCRRGRRGFALLFDAARRSARRDALFPSLGRRPRDRGQAFLLCFRRCRRSARRHASFSGRARRGDDDTWYGALLSVGVSCAGWRPR
jgi:hypothetical protein